MRVLCVASHCLNTKVRIEQGWGADALTVLTTEGFEDALNRLPRSGARAVIIRFPLQGWTPEYVLAEVGRVAPFLPAIVWLPAAKTRMR